MPTDVPSPTSLRSEDEVRFWGFVSKGVTKHLGMPHGFQVKLLLFQLCVCQ